MVLRRTNEKIIKPQMRKNEAKNKLGPDNKIFPIIYIHYIHRNYIHTYILLCFEINITNYNMPAGSKANLGGSCLQELFTGITISFYQELCAIKFKS